MSTAPSGATELRRLFFALWPPQWLQEQMHRLAQQLISAGSARLIPPDKLHLTLAFLGSVDAARQACYEQAADALRAAPFTLVLDQTGMWRRSGVVWIGSSRVPEALLALVRDCRLGLARCGYVPETRPFQVHITVARNTRGRRHAARGRVPAAGAPHGALPLAWPVDHFCLVQSQLQPDGARYEILKRWPLG